ncbi:MAG TPA: HEAT repeat domain-containing protein [Allosphingosinicella sp.]
MIFGNDLQDWVADRERQRLTQAGIDAFQQHWNSSEAHLRFRSAMALLVDARDAHAVAGTARELFGDDGWVEALVDGLASAMARDPFFDPPFRAINSDIHRGLIVYEDALMTVTAGVSGASQLAAKKNGERGATSVHFTGHVSVLKFVKSGGAVLSFWEAPAIGPNFSVTAAGRCVPTGARSVADGEILTVDGRFQSYVIDRVQSNLVVLQAEIKTDQAPVAVEYDSATGAYVGCCATDDSASRIQLLASLVRKLGHDDAFAALAEFLTHEDFFVRWHVMRELLGIDAGAALPLLRKMAEADPHPDPRRAAHQVLARIAANDAANARAPGEAAWRA